MPQYFMLKLRLDEAELESRRAFFEIADEDLALLKGLRPFAERHGDEIVDGLYELILGHPESSAFFKDEATVPRVKRLQRKYLLGLFDGVCDLDYVEDRLRVGAAHERIGLAPKWYIGAYGRYLRLLLKPLFAELPSADAQAAYASLLKLVGLDMSLTIDTYIAANLDSVAREQLIRDLEFKNQQLEAANRMKGEFLANMSHEIRTPLNAILGMTHLALRTRLDERQRNYLHDVHGAGQTLLAIVNDILDFSKAEAGRIELEHIELKLDEVLRSLISILARKAVDKGLELLISVSPEVPASLIGDPLRLGQVLLNLVSNAIKFTEHGEVLLSVSLDSTSEDNVRLRFEVKDTGEGITPDVAQRLFSAFSQADSTTTRKHGGTGLGLAICKRMVELMQGEIWVDSVPGQGASFSFTAEFGKSLSAISAFCLNGLRALVIDHNATRRNILCSALGTLSVVATQLGTSDAGLAEVTQSPYDLVFVDGQLPGGLELIRSQRKPPGGSGERPLIILMDDHGHEEMSEEVFEAGVNAVLTHPITLSQLHDLIMSVLGKTERRRPRYEPFNRKGLSAAMAALRGCRLLLVEDNAINQQIARELLEHAGMEVEVVGNGRIAVERVLGCPMAPSGELPWDLVLMDLQMPEMDGYTATATIRRESRFRDLPILAMTAHVLAEERDKCYLAGMNDYISKPIDPQVLFTTLSRWLPIPQPPAAAAPDPSFPPILRVDTERAVGRVAGNAALYRKLLLDLTIQQQQKTRELEEAMASGDMVMLGYLAHALKGVAGNLGLESVWGFSAELESLSGSPQALLAEVHESLGNLVQDFEEVCGHIVAALPQDGSRPETGGTDPAAAGAAMARLADCLGNHDGATLNCLQEVLTQLAPHAPRRQLDTLAHFVHEYDFESAEVELAALAKTCERFLSGQIQHDDSSGIGGS